MNILNALKNMDRTKTRMGLIILLLGAILLVMVFKIIPSRTTQLEDSSVPLSGVILDSDAKAYTGDMPENRSGDKQGIKIPGYASITIPANTTDVSMVLLNPEGNPCYFTFELVLKDTGESLYTSDMVEPSHCIEEVTLETPLEKGEYNATIMIRTYSLEDLSAMNNANVQTRLVVI